MPVYIFSVFSTPKSVIKEIRNIQPNFLWGGREAKAKFSLVKWDKICYPKDRGGMGLRDPEVTGRNPSGQNLMEVVQLYVGSMG